MCALEPSFQDCEENHSYVSVFSFYPKWVNPILFANNATLCQIRLSVCAMVFIAVHLRDILERFSHVYLSDDKEPRKGNTWTRFRVFLFLETHRGWRHCHEYIIIVALATLRWESGSHYCEKWPLQNVSACALGAWLFALLTVFASTWLSLHSWLTCILWPILMPKYVHQNYNK